MASEGKRTYFVLFIFIFSRPLFASDRLHSLQYNFIAISNSDQESFSYSALVYLDDQLFLHYGSKSQLELRSTSLEVVIPPDIWKKESENLKGMRWKLRATLAKITQQSQEKDGSHTLQVILGCDLLKNGKTRGCLEYGYDGENFLTFQPETLTWEDYYHPAANSIKNDFATDLIDTKLNKAKVEQECPQQLQGYLAVLKEKKASPSLHVTSKLNNLWVCWAYNIFPGDVKITWLKDGQALNQKEQESGILRPSGDGTYQTSVSIYANPKELNYKCHVEHQGKNQTKAIPSGSVRKEFQIIFVNPVVIVIIFNLRE
ncbi:MHC class I-like located near the LRC-like isoform X1 [Monodelphis domestica]|uniref:MHC class I-like located near the LRC-like n=1 Tax=Monodelphis domestica TaxID=13616 RepID=A0A5F8GUB8_MONDO|nr:MHC class I-like located near the LRC-like isoform X1 [Monodelphis domestica]